MRLRINCYLLEIVGGSGKLLQPTEDGHVHLTVHCYLLLADASLNSFLSTEDGWCLFEFFVI